MAIGDGTQGRLGNRSIKPRRQFYIDILAVTIEITEDIMVKVGIANKVGHKRVRIEGVVG